MKTNFSIKEKKIWNDFLKLLPSTYIFIVRNNIKDKIETRILNSPSLYLNNNSELLKIIVPLEAKVIIPAKKIKTELGLFYSINLN